MVDELLHRKALGCFASGVTVVTANSADGGITGLTASAFSSLSLDPPLILVCVGHRSNARVAFNESGLFVVHILAEDQRETALAFAKSDENKAAGIPWKKTENGTPILSDYMVALECRLTEEFFGGDHAIMIGKIIDIKMNDCERAPMTYYRGELNTLSFLKK